MKLRSALSTLALTLALASTARAQCLIPDNLDVFGIPCIAASTSVPQRGFQQTSLGICWKDCGVDAQSIYTAVWGALNPIMANTTPPSPSCAWYRARLRLYLGTQKMWDGQMFLAYARTWVETPVVGQFNQVWRYLVNGDLQATSPNSMPCGVPPCANSFGGLVRFTGYIDYSYDCGPQITERAWMITHACDSIDHVAGFPRAGAFHPGRNYSFVGPAAGFVPGLGGTLEVGTTSSECMRKWDALAMPARCGEEEPLANANLVAGSLTCQCGTGPSNWYDAQLSVFGAWGSMLVPFLSSAPFRSFPVGSWTNPNVFPGVEEVRWNCNEALFVDCASLSRQEFYYGVTTSGGFTAMSLSSSLPPTPLTPIFLDQSNSMILPANVATRNRPYRSDHIINLNL